MPKEQIAGEQLTFGGRLDFALRKARKSRRALATYLEVSPQAIGMTINGKTLNMNAANTVRCARFLGVDELWLATGDGDPYPDGTSPLARRLARRFDELADERQEQIYAVIGGLLDVAAKGGEQQSPAAPPVASGRGKH